MGVVVSGAALSGAAELARRARVRRGGDVHPALALAAAPIGKLLPGSMPPAAADRKQKQRALVATLAAQRQEPRSLQSDRARIELLNELGSLASDAGDDAQARAAFREMATLAKSRGLAERYETALLNLADHLTYGTTPADAEPLIVEALDSALQRGDADNLSFAHATQARVELALGRPRAALDLLSTALTFAEGLEDYWNRADLHGDCARAHLALGQPERALACAREASRHAGDGDHQVRAFAALIAADALRQLDRPAGARVELERTRAAIAQLGLPSLARYAAQLDRAIRC